MSADKPGFASRPDRERQFFLIFIMTGWVVVGMGFTPSIIRRFTGNSDYPAPVSLEIHVWSYFAWMTILTAQIMLVRFHRQHWHRILGLGIVVLIPVMAVSGMAAEWYSQHFSAPKDPENARFYIVPLLNIVLFVCAATLAFLRRSDPPAHKRLILMATAVILSAGFGRWWGDAIDAIVGTGFWGVLLANWLGTMLLMGAAAMFDQATYGRTHAVWKRGGASYVLAFAGGSALYFSNSWPVFVRSVLGLAPIG